MARKLNKIVSIENKRILKLIIKISEFNSNYIFNIRCSKYFTFLKYLKFKKIRIQLKIIIKFYIDFTHLENEE
jgi:hypothetical protein